MMHKTSTPKKVPLGSKSIPVNENADPDIYQAVKYFIKNKQ